MSLKGRLDALRRQAGAALAAEPARPGVKARLERLGGRAPAVAARCEREPPAQLAARLQGELIADEVILIERRLPLATPHGRLCLGDGQQAEPLLVLPAQTCFVDTETTGLAGGTGTVAFMVGIAEPEPGAVRLRQWLLTAFGGESALLAEVAQALKTSELLLSYNGKSFDLPLLRDRQRLQRAASLPEPPHRDLLHDVRRLFASSWNDCRLSTVERELLGLVRQDDLPGAQAPLAWKAYLRGDPHHQLERVLAHNSLDLLSLVVLGPALGRAMEDPLAWGADPTAVAMAWLTAGNVERALATLEQCRPALEPRGLRLLARLLRRGGRLTAAVEVWEGLAEQGCEEAAEQLAKYHEHVRRDWRRALAYAQRLGEGAAARHRRRRLQQRLGGPQGQLELE